MKNAHLRFGWLTYVKSTEKNDNQHQAAARPLHRRSPARPTPTGQSTSHFRDWRGHSGCGRQRGHLVRRPIHGGRAGRATDSSMPRAKCTMFQRLGADSRTQEAPSSLGWIVRRVRCDSISASSGRTLLGSSDSQFIWASIAHTQGIPGIPEWADWFAGELKTHRPSSQRSVSDVSPVLVKGRERTISRLAQLGSRE